jgi:hypothetical protein
VNPRYSNSLENSAEDVQNAFDGNKAHFIRARKGVHCDFIACTGFTVCVPGP